MRAGAVVIGGGVMGASIAWRLAERLDPLREPVVLLEKSALAAGSSGRSGAIVRQFYSHRALIGMARDSLRAFASFEATTGRAIGFEACGVLTLARAEAERELVRTNVAAMRELGVAVELVEPERMRALVPGIALAEDTLGAWEPDAGQVDPLRVVAAFAEIAKTRGASVRVGLAADEILLERGRVRGVRTREGAIETERVVLAAGAWSRALLAPLGIDVPLRAIAPEQHFLATPALEGRAPRTPAPGTRVRELERELDERLARPDEPLAAHAVLLDLERGAYARCEPAAGRTRVGSMDVAGEAELADPDALDETVSERFRAWARQALAARLPVYARQPDAGSLMGLYTMTPDGQAMVGELVERARGLVLVAGFSGHGFKLAPSIGEGVAQLALGEPVSAFERDFLDPARFARGHAPLGRGFGL